MNLQRSVRAEAAYWQFVGLERRKRQRPSGCDAGHSGGVRRLQLRCPRPNSGNRIRMAIGARAPQVVRLVLRSTAWATLSGLAGGLLGSLLVSRFLVAQLYGVSLRLE